MFNRVAGGNYTKAADISADIVGKNVHNMPEDDSRMPNTIADFIGDCVNDIAGNISDLGESFVATPVACILIAMQLFKDDPVMLTAACLFPIMLSAGGLLSSLIGVSSVILANRKRVKIGPNGEKSIVSREIADPSVELDLATYLSAIMVFIIGLVGAYVVFGKGNDAFKYGFLSPWAASVLGVISSVVVGKLTEYYTSMKYAPVQKLETMAYEGDSFVVTEGDAIGYRSTLWPVLVIGVSMILAYRICGTYGIRG
jgi:K(+)-stimulated pyrophosphate-energized sodium pump